VTAFANATPSETASVSFSDETACGVETLSQNADSPPLPDRQISAAIGRRTITLR
jgi:hypothetical protein